MNNLPVDINRLQTQQAYTNLNQLNDIRKIGHKDESLALKKVAQQFESMFMQMMIKSMRSANDVFAKDNPLNSFEVGFHRDMLDNQLSLSLSQDGGFGIGEALYRQLNRTYLSDSSVTGDIQPIRNDDGSMNGQRLISANPYSDKADTSLLRQRDESIFDSIKTPEDFINAIKPYAKQVAAVIGGDYKVLIAQAALETGWGRHTIRDKHGKSSFNLFNIKVGSRWQGPSVNVPTLEYHNGIAEKESANFRRYDTLAQAFEDYQNLLQLPRYQKALSVAEDGAAFINELQKAGYATDPAYAKKITQILEKHFNQ